MTEALYARVSSEDQTVDTQLEALRSRAPGAAEFVDVAKSGRADDRPQFEALLAAMRGGQVTSVYVTKLDRLGRSARTLLNFFEEARQLGIRVVVIDQAQALDTSTAIGRASLGFLAVFAQFEADLGAERSRDRRRSLKEQHARTGEWATRSGRPPYRPKVRTDELLEQIARVREGGASWAQVARTVHHPASSCRKWYAAHRKARLAERPA